MTLPMALGIYFICWWLVLFAVLPFGVNAPEQEGDTVTGHADSAPVQPRILLKFLVTTVISAILFAIVYTVIVYRLIPLDLLPSSF
jgi:predicted secreted protein